MGRVATTFVFAIAALCGCLIEANSVGVSRRLTPASLARPGGRPVSVGQKSVQSPFFAAGTATPAEDCGTCHKAIYREFEMGFGSDLNYGAMLYQSRGERRLKLPSGVPSSATAHAAAGLDPWPSHARNVEEHGRACNVCHFPEAFEIPDIQSAEIVRPQPRGPGLQTGGLTCASCHVTPDGRIRGPYDVEAPHPTVKDERMKTAAMCAYCHSMGRRVPGKQTQTFLEWREDFATPGLGRQQCQDCHMPRTMRRLAEDFETPERATARHLWTGGHSTQRLRTALSLVIVQPEENKRAVEFHVINIGAGHSVPTGSNRRAVYLRAEAVNARGAVVAHKRWMFAPWYGDRPDDRRFLGEDKARPDAVSAMQADRQGPHEAPVRAGEERILVWSLAGIASARSMRARLVYDLNRYNDPKYTADQTVICRTSLPLARGKRSR